MLSLLLSLLLLADPAPPGRSAEAYGRDPEGTFECVVEPWSGTERHGQDPEAARALLVGLRYGVVGSRVAPVNPGFLPDGFGQSSESAGEPRSIALAFGLSAVIPGAGQAYNRQWIKAGVALSLEALVVTLWATRHADGTEAEREVYAFAHARWSPERYASWLNDYVDYLGEEFGHQVTAPPAEAPGTIDFTRPAAWTDGERLTVDRFFRQIQAIERQVYHPETGASFSHQIPFFGEQQYYELIGKYFQFAPGWDDYAAWRVEGGAFTPAIDPELTGPGNTKPNVSATFRQYARDHAHSQDLLRSARQISMLFIVNHLSAAVDAAVWAKLHNDRLTTRSGLTQAPDGSIRPIASMTYRF